MGMKKTICLMGILTLLVFAGCQPSAEEPKIDTTAAKAAPGADTPPAAASPVDQAAIRADKAGK
jgi:hypothetical protein